MSKRVAAGPGTESVGDYPRPPALSPCDWLVQAAIEGLSKGGPGTRGW